VITHRKQQISFYCETLQSTLAALASVGHINFWPAGYLYCEPPSTYDICCFLCVITDRPYTISTSHRMQTRSSDENSLCPSVCLVSFYVFLAFYVYSCDRLS